MTSLTGVPYNFEMLDRLGLIESDCRVKTLTQAGGKLSTTLVEIWQNLQRARDALLCHVGKQKLPRISYLPQIWCSLSKFCGNRAGGGGLKTKLVYVEP